MRIFATSDLHIDFAVNWKWFDEISSFDYKDDILILAGDLTDIHDSMAKFFSTISKKFREVLFVPGNHDLWVFRNKTINSLKCFNIINEIAKNNGIYISPRTYGSLSIIPLLGWYDYTFGIPNKDLLSTWGDYNACKWPDNFDEKEITEYFLYLNENYLNIKNEFIITFSHFMPRIDIMPSFIPANRRIYYPVFGTTLLDKQIRKLNSNIHVYGHSHFNLDKKTDKIRYINNAFGYPYETRITAKELKCIYEV